MGEDGGDGEAAGALDVHEEGAGSRHKGLFVEGVTDISQPIPSIPYRSLFFPIWNCSYLELVLAGLSLRRGVEEVDRENLFPRDIRQFNILSFLSIKNFEMPAATGWWRRRGAQMASGDGHFYASMQGDMLGRLWDGIVGVERTILTRQKVDQRRELNEALMEMACLRVKAKRWSRGDGER